MRLNAFSLVGDVNEGVPIGLTVCIGYIQLAGIGISSPVISTDWLIVRCASLSTHCDAESQHDKQEH